MEYVIRLKNGAPFEHPITIDNFKEAFPVVDLNNLGSDFAEFVKVKPSPEKYHVATHSEYSLLNGKVYEKWHYREMTIEEKENFDKLQTLMNSGSAPNVTG